MSRAEHAVTRVRRKRLGEADDIMRLSPDGLRQSYRLDIADVHCPTNAVPGDWFLAHDLPSVCD